MIIARHLGDGDDVRCRVRVAHDEDRELDAAEEQHEQRETAFGGTDQLRDVGSPHP